MRKLTVMIILLLLLVGCSQKDLQVYVEADKLTYEAIADEYVGMVKANDKLDDKQKDRRYRLVKTWKMRIDNALPVEEEKNE